MFASKAGAYPRKAMLGVPFLVGSWPYLQTLDLAEKASQGRALWLIMNICNLQFHFFQTLVLSNSIKLLAAKDLNIMLKPSKIIFV